MRVTAETKSATRRRILEVAQKHFAQHGFGVVTTRDLAQAAGIAAGTLFNYFPTKEAIVEALVRDVYVRAADAGTRADDESSLNEALFAHIATLLRKLKPFRKYLPALLDSSFSPAVDSVNGEPSLRAMHLEAVGAILSRYSSDAADSAMALQLYWTLYTGVLAYWAKDTSPKQEDTLALLDESMTMFAGWLQRTNQPDL